MSKPDQTRKTYRLAPLSGLCGIVLALSLGSVPGTASALSFTPTDTEWATWGEMCRTRYVVSGAGRGSRFVSQVAPSDIQLWQNRIGDSWHSLHHFCAAKVLFVRAKSLPTERQRDRLLGRVISETDYTKARSNPAESVYAQFLVLQAQAHDALCSLDKSIAATTEARALHPDYGPAYSLEAIVRRRANDLDGAEKILLRAVEQETNALSEVHYLLAIVYRDKKQYQVALDHAVKAEELGYPLTRLKYSLQRKVGAQNTTASNNPE